MSKLLVLSLPTSRYNVTEDVERSDYSQHLQNPSLLQTHTTARIWKVPTVMIRQKYTHASALERTLTTLH